MSLYQIPAPVPISLILSFCFPLSHWAIFTLPAGAVAKYCDEYVCLSVCLSMRISPERHARSLPNFLCMLPMSVAWSFSAMLTIGRIAYRQKGATGVHSTDECVIYNCLVTGVLDLGLGLNIGNWMLIPTLNSPLA